MLWVDDETADLDLCLHRTVLLAVSKCPGIQLTLGQPQGLLKEVYRSRSLGPNLREILFQLAWQEIFKFSQVILICRQV